MKIAYCKTAFLCYNYDMTTNELIDIILTNHMNLDCLAQIAQAVESAREALEEAASPDEDGEPSDEGADAEWLASAGWGTDEDYGGFDD
jgi:hypothetical protein